MSNLGFPLSPGGDVSLTSTLPMAEAVSAATGAISEAARADHQHPRITSSTRNFTDASGIATVTFTRSFDRAPVIIPQAINDTGRAIDYQITDVKTGALWTGCIITARRGQTLPAVLTLLSSLISFDVFAGPAAANVELAVVAIYPSN